MTGAAALVMNESNAVGGPRIRDGGIDHIEWARCDRRRYVREHLNALKPAIVRGAIDHWPARGKWTPRFFHDHYGSRVVRIDATEWRLDALIERIEESSPERPAPYLRNELLADWPPAVRADVTPMPQCTRPNYLESRFFPARVAPTYTELYIGGRGAVFPIVHYDNRHTHAFLMQLYGVKEYLVFPPDQGRYLYPRGGIEANKSSIPDIEHVDFSRFPLYRFAEGMRFRLHAGETLFVPGGWWHTARIISTSITVSLNGANAGNWAAYRRDYCGGIASRSRLKAAVLSPYLALLGAALSALEP